MKKHLLILPALFFGSLFFSQPLFSMGQRPPQRERVISLTEGADAVEVRFGWKLKSEKCGKTSNDPNRGFIVFARWNAFGPSTFIPAVMDPSNPSEPLRIPFEECEESDGQGNDRGKLNIRILGLGGDDIIYVNDDFVVNSDGEIECFDEKKMSVNQTVHMRFNHKTNGCHFVIDGGPGNDRIFGSGLGDIIIGGSGNDFLQGRLGDDVIEGNEGNDEIHGNDALYLDKIEGCTRQHDEDNFLYGGPGNDILLGGCRRDILVGEEGHDFLDGGKAEDSLYGGYGNDTLWDSDGLLTTDDIGFDHLYGGSGNDIFCEMTAEDSYYDKTAIYGGMGQDSALILTNRVGILNRVESVCRDPNRCRDLERFCRRMSRRYRYQ